MAKKASVLRRRKSRSGKMQLGLSPTNAAGDGDFDDNVFEVEEGGRTGEIAGQIFGARFSKKSLQIHY